MKLVIFGLTLSSSWGNGHATLWRGLIAALARRGHDVVFFERDVPYYAAHRDFTAFPGAQLVPGDLTAASASEMQPAASNLATRELCAVTDSPPAAASGFLEAARR
jgi:spore maturation protein CgeB